MPGAAAAFWAGILAWEGHPPWITAGWPLIAQYRDEAVHELVARLAKAKELVAGQLALPAVIRKARATALVRQQLRLEPLTPLPVVPTMLPTI